MPKFGTYASVSSLIGSKPWSWANGIFDDEDDIRYLSANKAVWGETASGFGKETLKKVLNTPLTPVNLSLADAIDMSAVLLGKTPPNLRYTIPRNQIPGARLFDVSASVLGTASIFVGNEAVIPESVGFFGAEESLPRLNRFHAAAKALPEEAQQNIRILRGWAKSKGYVKLPNPDGRPETWGIVKNSEFERRLVIKPEPSLREGMHPISNKPRFEARLEPGANKWINPFTGEVGNKYVGSHIWLEDPYLSYEQQLEFMEENPHNFILGGPSNG